MSKPCPLYGKAIYLDCLECEDKPCNKQQAKSYKYNHVSIGIDQSYKNTGISIAADGKLLKVSSIRLEQLSDNTVRRAVLSSRLSRILSFVCGKGKVTTCTIERIRLHSRGFLSIDYIKAMGALNAVIVDACAEYGVQVCSVDTRCWKAKVVGTSKPMKNSKGIAPEKWPTILWVKKQGFEQSILHKVQTNKKKGTFVLDGVKYEYNDDAADSAAIAMYPFVGDKSLLKPEK